MIMRQLDTPSSVVQLAQRSQSVHSATVQVLASTYEPTEDCCVISRGDTPICSRHGWGSVAGIEWCTGEGPRSAHQSPDLVHTHFAPLVKWSESCMILELNEQGAIHDNRFKQIHQDCNVAARPR